MKRWIETDAAFYRGYLADDRRLTPHIVAWATIVALWSLVYLIGCLAPAGQAFGGRCESAMAFLAAGPMTP
jgi:hypothetical protein